MVLAIITLILDIVLTAFVGLTGIALQHVDALNTLTLLALFGFMWLLGIGIVLSIKWLKEEYDDYRFEKQLKKGFEK